MKEFAIGDDVWVDAVEGHFGNYIYSNKEITKAKVLHIDCVNPSRMIVSHNWQASSGMEVSIVDAKYVFHKYGDLLKHRASRRNVKVGDLIATIHAGRRLKGDNEVLFGVVYKITKVYVHFQSENGLRQTRVDNCIVLSRQEEKQNG